MDLPPRIITDDLISLPEISEQIILDELRKRYDENRIYVSVLNMTNVVITNAVVIVYVTFIYR